MCPLRHFPFGHQPGSSQTVQNVRPFLNVVEPSAQSLQASEAPAGWKVPLEQRVHVVEPAAAYVPAVQSAQEEAPSAAEEVPAEQEVQVAAPPVEKVPAEQSSVHSDALAVDEL